jgi:hypothetical protein
MFARASRHSRLLQRIRYRRNQTDTSSSKSETFLHIGPSGDCWTGASLFAAKHLTPDYVKSIPLISLDEDAIARLLDLLHEEPAWCHQMYDTQQIPDEVLLRVTNNIMDKTK